MINLIIYDFDGVLASMREAHYLSLNKALEEVAPDFVISREEHVSTFDGLSTKRKLNILESRGLSKDLSNIIFNKKQEYTMEMMDLSYDKKLVDILSKLKPNYKLYVASNAILQTIEVGLKKLGIYEFFDKIYSNEDAKLQKPYPQIYLKAIAESGFSPKETLIVEDSKHGKEAAYLSGAHICSADNCDDVTYERITSQLNHTFEVPWVDQKLNVLIPMSGAGSRFKEAGYKLPKPLIDVNGVPMIKKVIDNLNIQANYIFIVQKAHYEEYNLQILLPLIVPNCKIVISDGLTEGAACSALLAKEFINNDDHLLIANSDQIVEWNSSDFMFHMVSHNLDGLILTFEANDPKWSFAKVDEKGFVTEVAEKKPISNLATVGIYAYNKGSEFVKYAEQMIDNNIRTSGEFYVCPVYNIMINHGKKIKTFDCRKMWGIGTPNDLSFFLENHG